MPYVLKDGEYPHGHTWLHREPVAPNDNGSSEDPTPIVTAAPPIQISRIIPEELQTIMEKLTEIIRNTLGVHNNISTSDVDAPIDHGLLRGVLIELNSQDMKLPDDVGVVISAIQAYLNNGAIDTVNPLVC